MRRLAREDLFFLLYAVFGRKDLNHPWLYERCREVERDPNGRLDLWAREHYKSTIITYGLTIQDILCSHGDDPIKWENELTVGLFSHVRPISKKFLEQIKREFEINKLLIALFPDVLYEDPQREAPLWSLDSGIIVKRKSNPKEPTISAWGLVDGQPTAMHFGLIVIDDGVTRESVTTTEQINKTTDAWALSLNLSTIYGAKRYIGTYYHYNDTYHEMQKRQAAIVRKYPGTKDGTVNGEPVFLSKEKIAEKRREMGPYIFSCQILLDPKEDSVMGFKQEWLRFYDLITVRQQNKWRGWNFYLICDPANEKKKENDYTVMWVIGLAPDQNYYLVDGLRDRLNLTERTQKYFAFRRKYLPIGCGYEEYGLQCDRQHMEYVMEIENYRFAITPLGGSTAKRIRILGDDQVHGLVPLFEQGRIWLPEVGQLMYIDYERKLHDLVQEFITYEYSPYPVAVYDDGLDCLARILDPMLGAQFPEPQEYVLSAVYDTAGQVAQMDYDVLGD